MAVEKEWPSALVWKPASDIYSNDQSSYLSVKNLSRVEEVHRVVSQCQTANLF